MGHQAYGDRATDFRPQVHLRYLEDDPAPLVLRRHPEAARRLAAEHAWLIDRISDRLAVVWPEGLDPEWVRQEAWLELQRVAACVERSEEMAEAAAEVVDGRVRDLVAGSEWYRQAMVGLVRPLCEAWRGAWLAGRRPTDRMLCTRLRLDATQLGRRFMEAALAFVIDPAALLPPGMDARYGIADLVAELPVGEQLATALYYHQELTLREIGEVMGFAPERVQELLGRAAMCLVARAGLAEWASRTLSA